MLEGWLPNQNEKHYVGDISSFTSSHFAAMAVFCKILHKKTNACMEH